MWLFSALAIIIAVGTVVCYFALGYLPQMYIHLSAYAFILAGMGYLIELMKKREQNVEEHMEWILDKKFKVFSEELKTIRTMILKITDKRDYPDIMAPPSLPKIEINGFKEPKEEKPIFSAQNPKSKTED